LERTDGHDGKMGSDARRRKGLEGRGNRKGMEEGDERSH
jgi:hypothetical protein